MLAEIDVIAKSLQERGKTLASCRADLDTLTSAIKEKRTKRSCNLFNCRLGRKYIGPNATVTHLPVFKQAILKIQEECESQMDETERSSVEILRKESDTFHVTCTERESSMETRLAKHRKISIKMSEYVDTCFVLGSVAKIERVFSVGKLVFSQHRKAMTPRLFEALMFLEYN